METMRAAELLIEKIQRDYRGSVAVVVLMGSTIYHDTHPRSDLDLYFVVNDPRGYELGMTFILDGIGYDFWPISWERMTRIAQHEERITAILTEGKVLYHGSEEDLERFYALRSMALEGTTHEKLLKKARQVFDGAYKHDAMLQDAKEMGTLRQHGLRFLFAVTHAVALLNQDTVKRGRGKLKGEILAMAKVPQDFEKNYDVFFKSKEGKPIQLAAKALLHSTETLLASEEEAFWGAVEFRTELEGFYEEIINFYNKIHHGCETGDYVTALYAAHEIMEEVHGVFRGTGVSDAKLPDLRAAFTQDDIPGFLAQVEEHQRAFEALLEQQGVPIRTFESFEELERFLLNK